MANSPKERIAIDACIFIDAINESSQNRAASLPIFDCAERGEIKIYVSSLILCECIYIKPENKNTEKDLAGICSHFDKSYFEIVEVSSFVARIAQRIRATNSIEAADAIHIASAIALGVPKLITRDSDIKKDCAEEKKKSIAPQKRMLKLPLLPTGDELAILTPQEFLQNRPHSSHPLPFESA